MSMLYEFKEYCNNKQAQKEKRHQQYFLKACYFTLSLDNLAIY